MTSFLSNVVSPTFAVTTDLASLTLIMKNRSQKCKLLLHQLKLELWGCHANPLQMSDVRVEYEEVWWDGATK